MSKKARRAARRQSAQYKEDQVVDFSQFKQRKSSVKLLPRNITQEDYVTLIDDPQKSIIFATGPAGTGKTLIAVLSAIKALKEGKCEKIVITRPAVSVDEQHGFLPGTLIEKMAPWTRPIFDVFEEYYAPKEIEHMIAENIIEVCPLAYMRGRTFKNSYIISDELQNATPSQMKMLLTRIGEGSKIIATGDLAQHDRGFEKNGLFDFTNRLIEDNSTCIGMVKFSQNDVERHPAVKEVLRIYKDE